MKKIKTTNPSFGFRRPLIVLVILLLVMFRHQPALAIPLSDSSNPIPAAAMKLVQFCVDPKIGLDNRDVAALVDYVLGPKISKEAELPKIQEAPGAYYEFDTRINFSSFLQYSYNNQIPSDSTSPASLRYSLWTPLKGNRKKCPEAGNWLCRTVNL